MTAQITLTLPEKTLERAERWAQRMGRPVNEVLVQVIESTPSPRGPEPESPSAIAEWSDEEVLSAADLRMSEEEDCRLSELLNRQQANLLTPAERSDLSAKMLAYQEGLLCK